MERDATRNQAFDIPRHEGRCRSGGHQDKVYANSATMLGDDSEEVTSLRMWQRQTRDIVNDADDKRQSLRVLPLEDQTILLKDRAVTALVENTAASMNLDNAPLQDLERIVKVADNRQ